MSSDKLIPIAALGRFRPLKEGENTFKMQITLTTQNLIQSRKNINISDITFSDFAISQKSIQNAELIIFNNGLEQKVLKTRF